MKFTYLKQSTSLGKVTGGAWFYIGGAWSGNMLQEQVYLGRKSSDVWQISVVIWRNDFSGN